MAGRPALTEGWVDAGARVDETEVGGGVTREGDVRELG